MIAPVKQEDREPDTGFNHLVMNDPVAYRAMKHAEANCPHDREKMLELMAVSLAHVVRDLHAELADVCR